jgi:hypothetical protein
MMLERVVDSWFVYFVCVYGYGIVGRKCGVCVDGVQRARSRLLMYTPSTSYVMVLEVS